MPRHILLKGARQQCLSSKYSLSRFSALRSHTRKLKFEFLPKNAKKQPYTGPVNLQNVLELEEVSSCTQGIQASAFRHFRIIIRTISWLDQFLRYLFLTTWGFSLLVQVVYSWDFTCECVGVTEQLLGLEAGVQCSLLSFRLEKLQRVGWKCPVFATEACLSLPPSPALS